jgi:hypothetical protein
LIPAGTGYGTHREVLLKHLGEPIEAKEEPLVELETPPAAE